MKTFATAFALVSVLPGIFALTINTPTNVVSCQPILLSWADGTAPYYLSIIPGGQPSAAAIKTFPTQNGNSLTWNVDIQPNTGITLSLKDSTGTQAYSDTITIQGTDTSCVNTSVAVGGSTDTSAASGTTPAATGTATTAPAATQTNATNAATTSKSSSSGGSSSSKASGTSTGAGASTTSNAASKASLGKFGLAGVLGLVGLAAL